jgi:RND family efflux transporter MFP subunit
MRWGIIGFSVVALVAVAGALALGVLPRLWQRQALEAAVHEAAISPQRVTVTAARRAALASEHVLPGDAKPLLEAAIYSRTTGYLKRRQVDIGEQVEEGQLLAEIATPEIDAKLEQARATLLQSKAALLRDQAREVLAQADLKRAKDLLPRKGLSQQEFDTVFAQARAATATVAADESTIKANEADIRRLQTLQSFQKLTAPFSGVITAKNVDPGALVAADSPNSARELFHLMQINPLRVLVSVPQVFATSIKIGQKAVVYRKEDPDRSFTGRVTRTADALDPATRTLLTEVQVPNPHKALRPGMYLQVKFVFDRQVVPVMIPAAALATRTGAARVAVLDRENRVHYRAVQLGRDYGADVEVIAGLQVGDLVVVHPGDDLPQGMVVQPLDLPKNH